VNSRWFKMAHNGWVDDGDIEGWNSFIISVRYLNGDLEACVKCQLKVSIKADCWVEDTVHVGECDWSMWHTIYIETERVLVEIEENANDTLWADAFVLSV